MARREYDSEHITPENAEEKIDLFLKNARVGSVKFMAFCEAYEWRQSLNDLLKYQRMMEIIDNGGIVDKGLGSDVYTRNEVESSLRMAEIEHTLADYQDKMHDSSIPGYTYVSVFSHELIENLEKNGIQTEKTTLDDPILAELSSRGSALDDIAESVFGIKMAERRTIGQALLGLFRKLG